VGFDSNDEQGLIEQSLERFIRDAYSAGRWRAALREGDGFSRRNWATLADMGLLALPFDERDGGFGGSLSDVATVMQQLGRGLALEPYLPCVVVAGRLLARAANTPLRARWLSNLMSGAQLIGLAQVERGDRVDPGVCLTQLRRDPQGYRLDGTKVLVPVARALDAFLVTATDDQNHIQVCVVPAGSAGVAIRSYRTVDGRLAGDVTFHHVVLEPDALLEFPDVQSTLQLLLTVARAASSAESVGCMQALLEMTVEYARNRKQFGQPIGTFQVIKHRLVDCYAGLELARAMLVLACCESSPAWSANVAAAKAFIDENAIRIGHEAIQMHGGMGLTDELAVSHHHKRIVANSVLYGDRYLLTDQFVQNSTFTDHRSASTALPYAEMLSPQEKAFRQDVEDFLSTALTDDLRKAVRRQTCTFPEKEVTIAWQRCLNAKGWLAPHWPAELGGTGWTGMERFLFEYECAIAGAPERVPMGFRYVGPVIARFGSDWQKSYFLPKLLASEHYWAQGFSEPGAGSDLAAIKTAAVRHGDHYVVNGSKMWTTHAHQADWLFCIVRTDPSGKPQDGISFLLIDLASPGVRVEPIRLLAVDQEVNQVFFDDVRVPAANLVGESGRGWQYAKFLLELERGGSAFCGRVRSEFSAVKELISTTAPGLWHDKALVHRLAALEHRLMALEMLEFRLARSTQLSRESGAGASMAKLIASELQKDITEMGVVAAGMGGVEFEPTRPLPDLNTTGFRGIDLELVAMPRYLNTRAASIFGGSSEIQREIIAKQLFGFR
jgi:alkylation response protein AidB-like acyl-CoA dehydrogenase